MPTTIKKWSRWEFVTWGSGSAGLGYGAAAGGLVVLKSPQGEEVEFRYGGLGAGLTGGFRKIPKLKRAPIPDVKNPATVSDTAWDSTGKLAITTDFEGDELTKSDIQGPCYFVEAGLGLFVGGSGTLMYLGLDPKFIPLITIPGLSQFFFDSANAVLFLAGYNFGQQAGGGVALLFGYLS